MKWNQSVAVAALALGLGAMGCDNDNSEETLNLGVDSSAVLKDISAVQASSICEKVGGFFLTVVNQDRLCNAVGVAVDLAQTAGGISAAERTSCADVVAQCKKDTSEWQQYMDSFNWKTQCQASLGNAEIRIGCTATVGDLDKCYTEMVQVTNTVLGKVKCGMTLTSLTEFRNELSPNSVASCKAIAEKCERFWDSK